MTLPIETLEKVKREHKIKRDKILKRRRCIKWGSYGKPKRKTSHKNNVYDTNIYRKRKLYWHRFNFKGLKRAEETTVKKLIEEQLENM